MPANETTTPEPTTEEPAGNETDTGNNSGSVGFQSIAPDELVN